ncbi:hypothetical protein EYF80_044418 [Liparis tanakae]|uniref:Uncharacterized protein n=1 Tax=Liparis tanakae TaxID=230148 RepID=A0A4Z2FVZ5_9TELE|nr:hypothetical protein EYF80_044418 [Liparis tanakae]
MFFSGITLKNPFGFQVGTFMVLCVGENKKTRTGKDWLMSSRGLKKGTHQIRVTTLLISDSCTKRHVREERGRGFTWKVDESRGRSATCGFQTWFGSPVEKVLRQHPRSK